MIDLEKFCRKSYYAETLTEPFSEDNYTYASDGNILIRVDKILEIVKVYPSVNPKQILEENKINGNEVWVDPPKFKTIERNCSKCKGTGKITVCEECEGMGSLEFSNSYNDYDVECKSCFGKNIKNEKCEDCGGTGKYKEYLPIAVKAFAKTITLNSMYLEMIRDLPNIKISLQVDPDKPVKLKFDGGIGLLMTIESK